MYCMDIMIIKHCIVLILNALIKAYRQNVHNCINTDNFWIKTLLASRSLKASLRIKLMIPCYAYSLYHLIDLPYTLYKEDKPQARTIIPENWYSLLSWEMHLIFKCKKTNKYLSQKDIVVWQSSESRRTTLIITYAMIYTTI